jgi:glycine/D-amino acid oxidase-like deaminating enzyme
MGVTSHKRRGPVANGKSFDVAVIGGGLVGSALAYELSCLDASVVLVDEHHEGRATDAGAGILSPETTGVTDEEWVALAMGSGAHYQGLVARLSDEGFSDPGYGVCGLVGVGLSEGDDEWFSRALSLARERSSGTVSEIAPDDAHDLFPPMGSVRRAFHNPRAARVDGQVLNRVLGEAAASRGVEIRSALTLSLEGSPPTITNVETTGGVLSCGSVAIAGGAWSKELAVQLGVDIPLVPHKGQIVHLQLPDVDTSRWTILQPVLSYYMVPWPEGRIAVGGTIEPEAGFDIRPTAAGIRELLREALRVSPGLGPATFLEVRVGLRPMSPDDQPVLGRIPGWNNVYVATGHGANGLLMGPYSAKLVATSMVGMGCDLDITAFSPSRFGHRDSD